jgi:hypothetical protein
MTCSSWSSAPSSCSSAEAFAPVSVVRSVEIALCWLQRGAEKRTKRLSTNGDLPAVGFVGNAVNLLEVVRVGDDLVVGDDVLQQRVSKAWMARTWPR